MAISPAAAVTIQANAAPTVPAVASVSVNAGTPVASVKADTPVAAVKADTPITAISAEPAIPDGFNERGTVLLDALTERSGRYGLATGREASDQGRRERR
jgi:hypothetical protein